MKYFLIVLALLTLKPEPGWSINPFAKWTKTELVLSNYIVRRNIEPPTVDRTFVTTSYKSLTGEFNYFSYNLQIFNSKLMMSYIQVSFLRFA